MTNGDTLDSMLKWVKDTISKLPESDAVFTCDIKLTISPNFKLDDFDWDIILKELDLRQLIFFSELMVLL